MFRGSSPITLSLPSKESAPEVRALPSAGITRPQRSYDPVRHPLGPPPETTSMVRPPPGTGFPRLPRSPFQRAVPTTPVDRNRCMRRLLPCSRGLPRYSGGSASTPSLSRPAQASLALRPAGSLNRPKRPLSQGFDPTGCPIDPPASYQINRQLSGRNLPPLVTCAVGAH